MSVNRLTELIVYITTYVLTLWRTLFAAPPLPDNAINMKTVQREIQSLLPHHAILHIPPPAQLNCRIQHASDGYMIYGVNDVERINSGPVWEARWGWHHYSRQEVRAMRGQLPMVHPIEDAIIWQSDGSPIEAAIGFWVRQWRINETETESTSSSAVMVIGNPVSSVEDSGIEMEILGVAQEMV